MRSGLNWAFFLEDNHYHQARSQLVKSIAHLCLHLVVEIGQLVVVAIKPVDCGVQFGDVSEQIFNVNFKELNDAFFLTVRRDLSFVCWDLRYLSPSGILHSRPGKSPSPTSPTHYRDGRRGCNPRQGPLKIPSRDRDWTRGLTVRRLPP